MGFAPRIAWSQTAPGTPAGAIALRGTPVRIASATERRALEATPSWRGFTARHGRWSALWNARTASPHRAFGRPIPLPGFANDPAAVEASLRAFIASEPGTFGSPALEATRVQRVGTTWYVGFRQVVAGMPLLFSDWEFRVGANGRLFCFGADAHRDVTPVDAPRLPAVVARQAARAGIAFDPGRDRIEGGETAALLPVPAEQGLTYRPALEERV